MGCGLDQNGSSAASPVEERTWTAAQRGQMYQRKQSNYFASLAESGYILCWSGGGDHKNYCYDEEHEEYYYYDAEHEEYYYYDEEHEEYYCYDEEHEEYYYYDEEHEEYYYYDEEHEEYCY